MGIKVYTIVKQRLPSVEYAFGRQGPLTREPYEMPLGRRTFT